MLLHLMIVQKCGSGGHLPFAYDHVENGDRQATIAAEKDFQLKASHSVLSLAEGVVLCSMLCETFCRFAKVPRL